MKVRERIKIERNEVKRLATLFKVSDVSVYAALNNQTQTELAKKIRFTALKPKADGGCDGELWRLVERS